VKIFVSYSRRDAGDFANQIQRHLSSFNFDIFIDVNGIRGGDLWSNTIEENISGCDIFVVIVTHGALKSPHVEREVLQAQKEKKTVLPCFHRSVIDSDIKWGLNDIQGVEFTNEFQLARDLHSKIVYHKFNSKDKSRIVKSYSNNSQETMKENENKPLYKDKDGKKNSESQEDRIPSSIDIKDNSHLRENHKNSKIVFKNIFKKIQGLVKPSFPLVSEIRPRRLRLQKENNLITIIGSNFGKAQGTVWIESYPPVSEEEESYFRPLSEKVQSYFRPLSEKVQRKMNPKDIAEYEEKWKNEFMFHPSRLKEQFDVTPKTPREDNRILVSLDSIKDKLKPQKYVVRVEKDGILTNATTDAMFEITFPSVVMEEPFDNSTNVPIHSSIIAHFNEPMRISTITDSTFVLRDSTNQIVPGTVDSDGINATFKPNDNLFYKTWYTATITTGVTNKKGNPMPFEKTWTFKTKDPNQPKDSD
jgi:hypothetical protein